MRFGREVDDVARLVFLEELIDNGLVANIAVNEHVLIGRNVGQRIEVAGIGELVKVDDLPIGSLRTPADKATADKPGAACYENRVSHGIQNFLRKPKLGGPRCAPTCGGGAQSPRRPE